jgi:Protein of unknown function (DUF3617)
MRSTAAAGLVGTVLIVTAWAGPQLAPAQLAPARLYQVTTETGMPHLEENLRYTTRSEKVCMTQLSLEEAFPILTHPALGGCKLQQMRREADTVAYTLACEGGHGTTGQALWTLDDHLIRGTLTVKLGGKNMTFYQRITATLLGPCRAHEQ